MEDSHSAILSLTPPPTEGEKGEHATDAEKKSSEPQVSFFGVFDGHGGEETARQAGEYVPYQVSKSEAFAKHEWGQALVDGFLGFDEYLLEDSQQSGIDSSGCAATAVIITDNEIVCGNAGDSRTVLGRKGSAKPLSFDHKPENEGERSRINAAGGFVEMGRVNANLALSRALGDFNFKSNPRLPPEQQVVTANPDIIEHPLDEEDEFVVLACDGIWDCMTSQEVVEFVRRGIADKLPLEEICELLMEECLAPESDMSGIGCDNMTVCIVALLQKGQTKQEWYEMIAKRVESGDGRVAQRKSEEVKRQIDERRSRSSSGSGDAAGNGGSDGLGGAVGNRGEDDEDLPIPDASQLVQQLFGNSGDGVMRLNQDATSLLSRIGIRLNMHMPEEEGEEGSAHSVLGGNADEAEHEHTEAVDDQITELPEEK